jgi:hypothetical protein
VHSSDEASQQCCATQQFPLLRVTSHTYHLSARQPPGGSLVATRALVVRWGRFTREAAMRDRRTDTADFFGPTPRPGANLSSIIDEVGVRMAYSGPTRIEGGVLVRDTPRPVSRAARAPDRCARSSARRT